MQYSLLVMFLCVDRQGYDINKRNHFSCLYRETNKEENISILRDRKHSRFLAFTYCVSFIKAILKPLKFTLMLIVHAKWYCPHLDH